MPKAQFLDFVAHAYMVRERQISSLMHFSVYDAMYLVVILQQIGLKSVRQSQGDPFLYGQSADRDDLGLSEHFNLQFLFWRYEDDELIAFECYVKEYHVFSGSGLYVELDVEIEPFGEGPFDVLIDHLDARFFPVGDEVAVGLALPIALVAHDIDQYLQRQFQDVVVELFRVEVFDDDGQNGFEYFAVDAVRVDEGGEEMRHFPCLFLILYSKDKA